MDTVRCMACGLLFATSTPSHRGHQSALHACPRCGSDQLGAPVPPPQFPPMRETLPSVGAAVGAPLGYGFALAALVLVLFLLLLASSGSGPPLMSFLASPWAAAFVGLVGWAAAGLAGALAQGGQALALRRVRSAAGAAAGLAVVWGCYAEWQAWPVWGGDPWPLLLLAGVGLLAACWEGWRLRGTFRPNG